MRGAVSFGLAAVAVLWCAALLVLLPPGVASGDEWLIPLAIPLVLAVGTFVALSSECHRGRGATLAGVLAWLLFAYSVISGFSIGMAIMPAATALLIARAVVPSPR